MTGRVPKLFSLSLFLLMAISCSDGPRAIEARFIEVETLRLWQREGKDFVLADVRSRESFREERLPGAVSIPAENMKKARKFRNRAIVLYCWSEGTAIVASKDLGGYNVFILNGGIYGWRREGYETEGSVKRHGY